MGLGTAYERTVLLNVSFWHVPTEPVGFRVAIPGGPHLLADLGRTRRLRNIYVVKPLTTVSVGNIHAGLNCLGSDQSDLLILKSALWIRRVHSSCGSIERTHSMSVLPLFCSRSFFWVYRKFT